MPESTSTAAAPAASNTGLRDVVALSSSITSIENDILSYRGINIDELAENATFEEVIHLLWHGSLPKKTELENLRRDLAQHAALPSGLIEVMKSLPRRTKP